MLVLAFVTYDTEKNLVRQA